jgi:DivIVA domain-containing protein
VSLSPIALRRSFRRGLFGYRRADVDEYLDELLATHQALLDELDRTRQATASTERIGREVAAILRSLGESVAQVQERAERDAARLRAEAAAEADQVMAELDAHLVRLWERRAAVAEALDRAAAALGAARACVDAIDLASLRCRPSVSTEAVLVGP